MSVNSVRWPLMPAITNIHCIRSAIKIKKNIYYSEKQIEKCNYTLKRNKANLRDLIAATGLVILLKLDSNCQFFSLCDLEIWWMTSKIIGRLFYITSSFVHHLKPLGEFKLEILSGNPQFGSKSAIFYPCDLEIWWMTLKNNRAPLLCRFKLCASFHNHQWIQTKVTVRKRSIRVKISDLLSCVNLKFDGWPWKTIGPLFYVASSFMHHFIAIGEFKLKLQSGNAQLGQNRWFFVPCDLEIWRTTLKNNRAPLLCYFKLCASFHSHWWIQTGVTVQKRLIWVKIDDFFSRVTLKFDGWPWKTNRAPLLNNIKLYASFHHHMWIQTAVTVRKRLSWGMTSVTLTFDLWLWPFAWTSLLSLVITPENFMMIRWEEHSDKGVTDRQTDGQRDRRTDRQKEVFLELLCRS